jgi:hypothetical protein
MCETHWLDRELDCIEETYKDESKKTHVIQIHVKPKGKIKNLWERTLDRLFRRELDYRAWRRLEYGHEDDLYMNRPQSYSNRHYHIR